MTFNALARRRAIRMAAASVCLLSAAQVGAMTISESLFKQNGGNVKDPADGSANVALKPFVQAALSNSLLAAGQLVRASHDTCGGTWLGEDDRFTYVLAHEYHCASQEKTGSVEEPHFKAWNGVLIAKGLDRRDVAPNGGIAVYRLKRVATPADRQGRPLESPVIHDGPSSSENHKPTRFVSYHAPTVALNEKWQSPAFTRLEFPEIPMRTSGVMTVSSSGEELLEDAGGEMRPFDMPGAAWWQWHGGRPVIVGVQRSAYETVIVGHRLAALTGWLIEKAPMVRTTSSLWTVKGKKPMRSPNLLAPEFANRAAAVRDDKPASAVYVTVPTDQDGVMGPTVRLNSGAKAYSVVEVDAKTAGGDQVARLKLRARKDAGCKGDRRQVRMEDAFQCEGATRSHLALSFHPVDNLGLKAGQYLGAFDVEVHREGPYPSKERVPVRVNVNVGPHDAPN